MMTSKVFGIMLLVLLAGCRDSGYLRTEGQQATPPSDFRFVGQSSACFLQLPEQSRSIRVNCFHIDGRLHIHSNRWSKMPRWRGESWVKTVSSNPLVQIEIADKIYAMSATAIDDEEQRTAILRQRGYWYAWDGITVFSFTPIGEKGEGRRDPRQVGKTTLAKQIGFQYGKSTHHFDLENPTDLHRLTADAQLALSPLKGL